MLDQKILENQILLLMSDKMDIHVDSMTCDLFEQGYLDSLSYIRLVVELQQAFEIHLSLAQIDVDQFRTIEQIADYLLHLESAPVLA